MKADQRRGRQTLTDHGPPMGQGKHAGKKMLACIHLFECIVFRDWQPRQVLHDRSRKHATSIPRHATSAIVHRYLHNTATRRAAHEDVTADALQHVRGNFRAVAA